MKKWSKYISGQHLKEIFVIVSLVFLLISCSDQAKANADRAIAVFFLGVLQLVNLMLFGVTSIVFSAIGITNPKPVYRILGSVFLGIFSIFTTMGYLAVNAKHPRHFDIYWIFIIEIAVIILCLVLLLKPKKIKDTRQEDYLDKILDDKNEVL